ncbi:hypothetical protein CY34DRAFT_765969 [Suillus luteus UH-Slu-Lm8-n1]|uniref:Uncharacterized protein n=1 Tax=Suillus luteus UH-Slu-Lm8-n1 TaxID=930992 RepID=A0A0D0ABD5_9AGAM|nr:hypothetical protein CY34DRAFT_765969 [Suillus luteus UH-Slu-Lm8-n1]
MEMRACECFCCAAWCPERHSIGPAEELPSSGADIVIALGPPEWAERLWAFGLTPGDLYVTWCWTGSAKLKDLGACATDWQGVKAPNFDLGGVETEQDLMLEEERHAEDDVVRFQVGDVKALTTLREPDTASCKGMGFSRRSYRSCSWSTTVLETKSCPTGLTIQQDHDYKGLGENSSCTFGSSRLPLKVSKVRECGLVA